MFWVKGLRVLQCRQIKKNIKFIVRNVGPQIESSMIWILKLSVK